MNLNADYIEIYPNWVNVDGNTINSPPTAGAVLRTVSTPWQANAFYLSLFVIRAALKVMLLVF
jgi:hypothetical protein